MPAPCFQVAADLVVLTVADGCLQLALVERGIEPFRGVHALPGGFVLPEESVERAARRELVEETGLDLGRTHLEQLATFGSVGRDPRGRVVAVAHLVLAASLGSLTGGSDATSAAWHPVDALPKLAFDHEAIVAVGLERARAKLEYTTIATRFCGPTFTMAELRRVYEICWSATLDARNFSRKVLGSPGFVVEAGIRSGTRGRPATLYKAGDATTLHPAILRDT